MPGRRGRAILEKQLESSERITHTHGPLNANVSSPSETPPAASTAEQARWFSDEVHSHESSLRAYVRSSFPSLRDVDDVLQESYLRVWKTRATQSIRSGKAFLFTVARHVALDLLRRTRNAPMKSVADFAQLPVLEDRPNAAETFDAEEKAQLLGRALARLPERAREIVVLRKLQGLSQKEVAQRLGMTEAAIEHHVSRSLKRCEGYLRQSGLEDIYDETK